MGLMTHKKDGERRSLKRSIAWLGFVALLLAFGTTAWKGKITSDMFITFPIGALIFYAPQLAVTLLQIWKGIFVPLTPQSAASKQQDFGGDV